MTQQCYRPDAGRVTRGLWVAEGMEDGGWRMESHDDPCPYVHVPCPAMSLTYSIRGHCPGHCAATLSFTLYAVYAVRIYRYKRARRLAVRRWQSVESPTRAARLTKPCASIARRTSHEASEAEWRASEASVGGGGRSGSGVLPWSQVVRTLHGHNTAQNARRNARRQSLREGTGASQDASGERE
eukprot:scaffold25515_cov36-Tisochrysis_lutea.AAC.5